MDSRTVLDNVSALSTQISQQDLSGEYDQHRRLPSALVEQLRRAGVFRMNMPKSWGGPEMSSMDQVRVVEALSRADASVGWCAFIWCDSGIYSGYLQPDAARALYPELDMAQSGWVYPAVAAEQVEGGYRVSGRWIFGSGCNHCDRLAAGCYVVKNGQPVVRENGAPEWRILLAKPEEFEIQDTWYTLGLRGTGSHDYIADNLFVPYEHSFSFADPAPRPGTIWAKPDHLLRKMSGVPLGIARAAIDRAVAILEGKVDRRTGAAYKDSDIVQQTIGEVEAKLGAARAYVYDALTTQWRKLEAGEPLTRSDRAAVVLSRQLAFQSGREVVQTLFDLIGGDAVYARNPFERYLRDITTACQHIVAQRKTLQAPGGLLLGAKAKGADIML